MLYSTYLGRPNMLRVDLAELRCEYAVDATGRTYLSGTTTGGFPVVNAYQPTFGGTADAFIAVLNPAGDALVWSTFLGGKVGDVRLRYGAGSVRQCVCYWLSQLADFPHCTAFRALRHIEEIWVAKFNSAGALQYSTIYGSVDGLLMLGYRGRFKRLGLYSRVLPCLISTAPTTSGAFRSTCSIPFTRLQRLRIRGEVKFRREIAWFTRDNPWRWSLLRECDCPRQ